MEDQNKCAAALEEMLPRLGRKKESTEKGRDISALSLFCFTVSG